jgi:hypothetical protein
MLQMVHDDITVFFENGESNEKMEVAGQIVCPKRFPQAEDVPPTELALVPNEQHAEIEKEVSAIG